MSTASQKESPFARFRYAVGAALSALRGLTTPGHCSIKRLTGVPLSHEQARKAGDSGLVGIVG